MTEINGGNLGPSQVQHVDPYRAQLREQTELLKSIRNGVSIITVIMFLGLLMMLISIFAAASA